MKALAFAVAMTAITSQSFAQTLTFDEAAGSETMVEDDGFMGSTAEWIIPLIFFGVLIYVATSDNGGSSQGQNPNPGR